MIPLKIRIPSGIKQTKEEFLQKTALEKLNNERRQIIERINLIRIGLFPPFHPNTTFKRSYEIM